MSYYSYYHILYNIIIYIYIYYSIICYYLRGNPSGSTEGCHFVAEAINCHCPFVAAAPFLHKWWMSHSIVPPPPPS